MDNTISESNTPQPSASETISILPVPISSSSPSVSIRGEEKSSNHPSGPQNMSKVEQRNINGNGHDASDVVIHIPSTPLENDGSEEKRVVKSSRTAVLAQIPAVANMSAAGEPLLSEKEDLHQLVPSLCTGAGEICFKFNMCCCLLIVLPCAVLIPISFTSVSDSTALGLRIATIAAGGLAVLYFLYSLRACFYGAVLCMPRPPAQTGPLCKATEGEFQSHQIKVRKAYVIYNPYGGTKKGAHIFENIVCKKFRENNIEITALKTEYAGHARDYAKTIDLNGYDCIVCIGGDGTFHETANGLLNRSDHKIIPIGIIPGGSGNSVMLDLGTWDCKEATDRIVQGNICYLDVNHVKDQHNLNIYSVNEISWGLIGDVGVVAENWRIFGPSRYDLCAVWLMLKKVLRPVKIQYKDPKNPTNTIEIQGEYLTAFANVTQHFGKGLRAAPRAKMDDGCMDLVFMKNGSRGELFTIFQQLPKGAHDGNPNIEFIQTSEAILTPGNQIGVINIDGEMIKYEGAISIKCKHKCLPIFLSPEWKGSKASQ